MFHLSCNCFRFNQVSAAKKKNRSPQDSHTSATALFDIKIAQAADGTHCSGGRSVGGFFGFTGEGYFGALVALRSGCNIVNCRSVCLGERFAIKATCLYGHHGGAYGGACSAVLCVCLAQRRRIRTAFRLNFRGVLNGFIRTVLGRCA